MASRARCSRPRRSRPPPLDRVQVLRREPGDGRGAPRGGLLALSAREALRRVPDQPAPEDAARPDPDRLALGHEVPRHADHDRGARHGGLRLHAQALPGAAVDRAHTLRHAGRGAARRLRRPLPERLLREPDRRRAARARGVSLRRLPAHARSAPHGGRVGGDGLAGGRGPGDRPPLAADAGVPEDAVLEDRAQREAPRPPLALRARALRGARHPPVRERGTVGLKALRRAAPWAVTLAIFAFLFWRIPARSVASTLAAAQWGRYLVLMVPYSLFYVLMDSFVVQQAVSWFNVRVGYRDILPVRATAYILALVNSLLGQGGVAVYLHRRHGLPFWEITGTMLFMSFVEIYQLALYSFVGAAAAGELGKRAPVGVYVVLALYLVLHLWYFSRPRGGRLGELRVLGTFRRARLGHYLRLLAYKTPNLLAAVTV